MEDEAEDGDDGVADDEAEDGDNMSGAMDGEDDDDEAEADGCDGESAIIAGDAAVATRAGEEACCC